ncbi:MAG: hypothetical protein IPK67_09970 [Planctomycetes bacterium]|nr:hypothetical protein [Planctomycetota bacterium]
MAKARKKILSIVAGLGLVVFTAGLGGCSKHYHAQQNQAINPEGGSGLGATRSSRRNARLANWGAHKQQADPMGGLLGADPVLGGSTKSKAPKRTFGSDSPLGKQKSGIRSNPRPKPRPKPLDDPFGTATRRRGSGAADPFADPFKGL